MFGLVSTFGDETREQNVIDFLFTYLNRSSHHGEFIKAAANQHRTLQQAFTKLCVAWLEHLSKLQPHQYDARNEDSVALAKAVTKTEAWEDKKYLRCI